ncbi:Acetyltransferase (GNAT) family [Halanaeroarchaeum sp. HSR-CO]|uniref:GNAT family N-acetyltransferase n=1 Tax=Halanaeroarchaeum sp. HSR-CO TaxID=2866382 RepID=UPI00217E49E3|nr:GNAT family N-acetyltransferase [Halanaeroarchaeum sp. HSR-CO]UWG49004.1 Acetyltransferase (GNAT) family [Halanaeroarchaeum sp. HSR-CO]
MTVREATPGDLAAVMNVLDGANIAITADTVARRIEADMVLVAGDQRRPLGALVAIPRREGVHIEAIAVRRRRRDQGIGTALVEAAADRWGRLTATFDPPVRPFYESLSFDLESRGERYWAERV